MFSDDIKIYTRLSLSTLNPDNDNTQLHQDIAIAIGFGQLTNEMATHSQRSLSPRLRLI